MFIFSKVVGFLLQPTVVLVGGLLIAVVALMRASRAAEAHGVAPRPAWRARWLAGVCATALVLIGLTPVGDLAMLPLEERFPRPAQETLPDDIAGIIVLGGASSTRHTTARKGIMQLNEAADRLTDTVILARANPGWPVVLSGGSAAILTEEISEATSMRELMVGAGVDVRRLLPEPDSRNTFENAQYSARLIAQKAPQAQGRWLLVTSAFHMPRAVGCFRAAGVPVLAWPTDYRTSGDLGLRAWSGQPSNALRRFDMAVREWIGLVAYYAMGRTSDLLPAP